MRIGSKEFDVNAHCYVMGILNVTPDSFSDGSKWQALDQALFHVEEMMQDGMDILDIGGESTRPGYTLISEEEELARVLPVIEAVKKRFDVPISLDTYKAGVASGAAQAGIDLVNDIWGLKYDGKMAEVIARFKLPCVLMHNRKEAVYTDFMGDVISDLKESVCLAQEAGIARDKIIVDPGVGFAKSYEQNLEVIRHLERLKEIGLPILMGCSRKSVIGLTLDLPANERLEGTLAIDVISQMKGASFIRVHDVKAAARALRMTEAILG